MDTTGAVRRACPSLRPVHHVSQARLGLVALSALALSGACASPVPDLAEGPPGEPLPGLTQAESDRFAQGRALFAREFTEDDGLGPLFNQARCSSCHDLPTSGGHGAEPVRKATRWDGTRCDLLVEGGGDLLQTSVTDRGRAAGLVPELTPEGATGVVELQAPPLYGLGLVEAIDPADLRAAADPDDADGDGISGRLAPGDADGPGRFGMKANHSTLYSFIEEATRGELGLTTPDHPFETRPQGGSVPEAADPASDPEVDRGFLDVVTAYVRFLAPPEPVLPTDPGARALIAEGREAFDAVGCASCHTPEWTTGPNPSPALDRVRFRAYSDFLLHDLGPDVADICGPSASPSEWRTARLVGLAHRRAYLHDGRAQSIDAAIQRHGGEATASRDRYRSLPEEARQNLLRFLQSL